MEQFSFDFREEDPHPVYASLTEQDKVILIGLMADFIISAHQLKEQKEQNDNA